MLWRCHTLWIGHQVMGQMVRVLIQAPDLLSSGERVINIPQPAALIIIYNPCFLHYTQARHKDLVGYSKSLCHCTFHMTLQWPWSLLLIVEMVHIFRVCMCPRMGSVTKMFLQSLTFCAIEMLFLCEMYILGYILIKVMRDFVGR